MAFPYTHTTRANGTILTASIYNTDHANHIDNNIPSSIDDDSTDIATMRLSTDPGEVGTESLATNLQEELRRIRFAIQELKGTTYWYETADTDLASIADTLGSARVLEVQVFS